MNAESGYAEVNGTKLYYETKGRGQPIVLIHGFTLDTRMWDDQYQEFSKQYKVMRYDLRIRKVSEAIKPRVHRR